MEKSRAKALVFTSFAVALLLAIAVTLTTVSLTGGQRRNNDDPGGEVSAAIVFAVPVNYTAMLKGFSATELQYNETMARWESHKAVGLQAPLGTPVVATFGGVVAAVTDNTMFGRQVIIDHRDGLRTVFSNLDRNVNVNQGDRVEKGQRIGSIGQTGSIEFIDIPHLRVEVLRNGVRIDPGDFIDFPIK